MQTDHPVPIRSPSPLRPYGPLRHWNQKLRKLTGISDKDIKQAYEDLIDLIDKEIYNNKLRGDPTLFITNNDS